MDIHRSRASERIIAAGRTSLVLPKKQKLNGKSRVFWAGMPGNGRVASIVLSRHVWTTIGQWAILAVSNVAACRRKFFSGFRAPGSFASSPFKAAAVAAIDSMPNTKSAKKSLKKDRARRTYNRAAKSAVKTQIKKVVAAASQKKIDVAEAEFIVAARKLDKAAARGVMHKNTAARRKSRLSKRILAEKKAGV